MAVFSLYMGWQMGRISVTILDGKWSAISRIYDEKPDDWRGSLGSVVVRDSPVVSFL